MTLYLGENIISGSLNPTEPTRNLGQIIESILPLTDVGLHLLDGALIQGSGIYADFVTKIGELYNSSAKVSNVTKVGSLADNNGVLSGFSGSNYATLPNLSLGNNFEIMLKITTGSDITSSNNLWARTQNTQNTGLNIAILNGVIRTWISSNGSTYDVASDVRSTLTLSANTSYYIKVTYDSSTYLFDVSTDKINWINYITINSSSSPSIYTPLLGSFINESDTYWRGSIDLNESYININGQRWWTGANPTWAIDESVWQTSVNTYGVCGKFVYNSTNNTVRLPKITGIVEGTTDIRALGDLVEAGLPISWLEHKHTKGDMNITASFTTTDSWGNYCQGYSSGAFTNWNTSRRNLAGSNNQYENSLGGLSFDASRNWSGSTSTPNYTDTSHDSSTVQPQTIKVFYYIVIATTAKTDIEVDIDEITTDLNNKVDLDGTNATFPHIVETYVNGTSGYNLYSNGYCEQWGFSNAGTQPRTITFTQTYKDTNYIVTFGDSNEGYDVAQSRIVKLYTKSTTGMTCTGIYQNGVNTDYKFYWRTTGYIR